MTATSRPVAATIPITSLQIAQKGHRYQGTLFFGLPCWVIFASEKDLRLVRKKVVVRGEEQHPFHL
jgi:hypothetical protein